MLTKMLLTYLLCFLCCFSWISVLGIYVPNLNATCARCLCDVSGCDMSHGCTDGYCGPFYLSRIYWADAGKPTLPDDDVNRKEAFEDCAKDYHCSMRIVKKYMAKFGKDCNRDGVTDCYDYMMINHNGGRSCHTPLYSNVYGMERLTRFAKCKL